MQQEILCQLFKTEYRKTVSVLYKLFGLDHIEVAQDIVSDAFLLAAETWGQKGFPKNPTAWLYTVSKNRTKDYLKRNSIFQQKIQAEILNLPPKSRDRNRLVRQKYYRQPIANVVCNLSSFYFIKSTSWLVSAAALWV